MYNLIFISSAICTNSEPLSYTPSRSVFSHEERYKQTIVTIESIRNKINDSYIVLIEGTIIPEYMRTTLELLVDYYYDTANDIELYNKVNGPYKGYAECCCTLSYFQSTHWKENNKLFKSASKINGRYRFANEYKFECVDDSLIIHIIFDNPHHHTNKWMSALYYTIPQVLFEDFINILNTTSNDEELKIGVAYEHILANHICNSNVKYVNKPKLFVEGEYGPWGGYVCH